MAVSFDQASAPSTIASKACARARLNPYADAQALKGLSMLAQALPRVKADPAISTPDGLPDWHLALDGAAVVGGADGASHASVTCWAPYSTCRTDLLLRDAAVGDALEQKANADGRCWCRAMGKPHEERADCWTTSSAASGCLGSLHGCANRAGGISDRN